MGNLDFQNNILVIVCYAPLAALETHKVLGELWEVQGAGGGQELDLLKCVVDDLWMTDHTGCLAVVSSG